MEELGLPVSFETRTGDTPSSRRQRQKTKPPDFLMTTPESLALLLSYDDAPNYFSGLRFVIVDELHAFFDNKRGDLLSLNLARLTQLAPEWCGLDCPQPLTNLRGLANGCAGTKD